jgi:hypothetical protein
MVSVKIWGARLHGRVPALELRNLCQSRLKEDEVLTLNMAGVKDITPGFAYECFGKLYLEANKRGARIKFNKASKEIEPTLLSGIKAALN